MSNLALKWCQTPFWAESNWNQFQVLPREEARSRVYEKNPVGQGESRARSKEHLRSVSLSLLRMAPSTSIHSILRLRGVQQHLYFGGRDYAGDEVVIFHLETGDGVQLCCLLINFTWDRAGSQSLCNSEEYDESTFTWTVDRYYQKIKVTKHIYIGLKNPHSPGASSNGKVTNNEGKGLTSANVDYKDELEGF